MATYETNAFGEMSLVLHDSIYELIQTLGSPDKGTSTDTAIYRTLAKNAKEQLSCQALGLYVIDPGSSIYQGVAFQGAWRTPRSIPCARADRGGKDELAILGLLSEAISTCSLTPAIESFYKQSYEWFVVGIRYKRTPCVFIAVTGFQSFPERDIATAVALVELAFQTEQNRIANNALHANERALDIAADDRSFYEELQSFIVEATGMQFVILRMRGGPGTQDDSNLRGVLVNGWDEPTSKFDIIEYPRYALFNQVIMGRQPLFRPNLSQTEVQEIWRDHPHLSVVESFVLFPIEDDVGRIIAVLTLGAACHLDFTPVMESVVKSIARHVGSTLKLRDLHFARAELQSVAIENAAALTAVEVYSDLMHQMGNSLASIPEIIETIAGEITKGKGLVVDELLGPERLGAIEEAHDQISTLINQAAGISSPEDDELQSVEVRDILEEAKSLVQYRLHKYGISVTCNGGLRIEAFPDQLRQVFFHLLLNSINAFASRSRRQALRIDLQIHRPKDVSGRCRIRYVDNAGGINPASLRRKVGRGRAESLPSVEQAIFMRGVSSRADGSGNGLWVVRQILQRHSGGINLINYRDGVVFDIELPIRQDKLTLRRGE